ncbi:MAG TPA: transglycosylase domain-containing protein [Membranihabitans sp.]|nr:transglycosylase domain-containing protein [Membranihabitans sp.]
MSENQNSKDTSNSSTQSWKEKLVKILWICVLGGVGLVFLIFLITNFTKLPTFEDLENPTEDYATEIYFNDNTEMGRFFVKNRVPVRYDEISPHVINALISTEDERFYRHSGIDFEALTRVLVKRIILQNKNAGGGSTITQQLAKLLFTPQPASTILARAPQKLQEMVTAIKLERSYTKEEIISMYLNQFEFGYNAHGIKAASETFFNTSPGDLTINQAAVLVGMLKNPSYYNPRRFPEHVRSRRNVVLYQMYRHDYIDVELKDSLQSQPVDMSHFTITAHNRGPAPYFRMELKKHLDQLLARDEYLKPDGTRWNLDKDGLRIYTTLDPRMQMHAEAAVNSHMKRLQKDFFKHWSYGATPWSYGTDKDFVALKFRHLENLKMESDRFITMKAAMFDSVLLEIEKEFDNIEFTPYTLEVLESAKTDGDYFQELIEDKLISPSRSEYLRKVAKSNSYQTVSQKWNEFKKKADAIFDEKRNMTVFAYNSEMEKDTLMSPMDSIKYHRMILQTGVLAIEPGTGYVKAWVGGVNFQHFQNDHVQNRRQVGSTFKPFVYATSIAIQGVSPCTKVLDRLYTIVPGEGNFNLIQPWGPKNSNGEFTYEPVTLYEGLRNSINSVSVHLMQQLGDVSPVIQLASNMGIDPDYLPNQPSICLGTPDLTLMSMTGAYSTFSNNGVYVTPTFITTITDSHGNLIYRSITEESQALQPDANYVMVDMLQKAAQGRPGINQLKTPNGGKTGTTQNQTDGWYMGITPNLVVGTWVGGEDRWIRFRSLTMGQGSVMARPIFSQFMKSVEDDEEINFNTQADFFRPPGELDINIDCDRYDQNGLNPDEHPEESSQDEEFFGG